MQEKRQFLRTHCTRPSVHVDK